LFIREHSKGRPFGAAAALAAGVILTGLSLAPGRAAAGEDFAAIFGGKYAEAERFLGRNAWIEPALQLPTDETRIALAVVFPEILRFNALEDEMQVRGLKVLYVQSGRAYMNFSVGRFQMKPSFVEHIESDYNRLFTAGEKAAAGIPAFEPGDTSVLREKRVLRLDELAWQVRYLGLFMWVMKKRYGHIVFSDVEDRLRFYATAYNAGYASGETALRRKMEERRFHIALLLPKSTYNYADVALFYFRRRDGSAGGTIK